MPQAAPTKPPTDGNQDLTRSDQEEAAIAASETEKLEPNQVQSATEWFMSAEPEPPAMLSFDVNVAPASRHPKWVRWTVQALPREVIKRIREDATDPNTGAEDDMEVNMRVFIAGSVEPNFNDPQVRGRYADPADAVRERFAHKPGIIERVAAKVNEASGYGTAQVIRPVDAAGN